MFSIDAASHFDEIIRASEDESFLKFEIKGYSPGTSESGVFYDGNREKLSAYDPGESAIYDDVKAFLIIAGKLEIELTEIQSEKVFSVFSYEFFSAMQKEYEKERGKIQ